MKIKIIAVALLATLIITTLTGCQLALPDGGVNGNGDRLIGVYLTKEHLDLFDFEGYLNENINGFSGGELKLDGDTASYDGRKYATLIEQTLTNVDAGEEHIVEDFVFEEIEGIPLFTATIWDEERVDSSRHTTSDDGISNGHTNFSVTDNGETVELEGTVYMSTNRSDNIVYFNPVYQSTDGRVYLTSGSGMSSEGAGEEGALFGKTMESTTTIAENGKSKTVEISVKISMGTMHPPQKISVLQMDEHNALMSKEDFQPNEMPEELTTNPNTDYLIVETHKIDYEGNAFTQREIFSEKDESFSTFSERDDGICVKKWTQIIGMGTWE